MNRPQDVVSLDAAIQEWRTCTLQAMRDASDAGDVIVARALGCSLNALRDVPDQAALDRIGDRVLLLHGCLWSQIAGALRDPSLL